MKKILIVTISTVIWCPRSHNPLLGTLGGLPIPFTTVKCVELAIEIESKSLARRIFDRNTSDGMSIVIVSMSGTRFVSNGSLIAFSSEISGFMVIFAA